MADPDTVGDSAGQSSGGKKSIRVKVLYFARAREICGRALETWDLSSGATAKDLEAQLLRKYEGLSELTESCAWAINEDYADASQVLEDGDEVALIPPISGG